MPAAAVTRKVRALFGIIGRKGHVGGPNVAVQPLSPATDRRLGRPLPHQLSNQTQGHLLANYFFPTISMCYLWHMRY